MTAKNLQFKPSWFTHKRVNGSAYHSHKQWLNSFVMTSLLMALAVPAYACNIPKSYYKHVSCTASEDYFLAVRDSGSPVALLNAEGKKAVDLMRYAQVDVNNFNGELLPVQRSGKVGYVNMSGREVVPAVYDVIIGDPLTSGWARPVSDNRIVVKKNGKFGIIDGNNKVILPFSANYQSISNYKASVAKIVKNGNVIWVDKRARRIQPPRPAIQAQFTASGLAGVGANDLTNTNSAAVANNTNPPSASQSSDTYVGNANTRSPSTEVWQTAKRDGKWGFVNSKDVPMITFSFDDVTPFSEGLAGVRLNDKWGFVNLAGDLVIPFRFDEAGVVRDTGSAYRGMPPFMFKNGKAWVGNVTSGAKMCIDMQGEYVSCEH